MQREVTSILGGNKVLAVETRQSVAPYGGARVLAEYLRKTGCAKQVR